MDVKPLKVVKTSVHTVVTITVKKKFSSQTYEHRLMRRRFDSIVNAQLIFLEYKILETKVISSLRFLLPHFFPDHFETVRKLNQTMLFLSADFVTIIKGQLH